MNIYLLTEQETMHWKARSLLTHGRSCKPRLLESRFRMQQADMHGLRGW